MIWKAVLIDIVSYYIIDDTLAKMRKKPNKTMLL